MKEVFTKFIYFKEPEEPFVFKSATDLLVYLLVGLVFFIGLGVIAVILTGNLWLILLYVLSYILYCFDDLKHLYKELKHDSK